MYIATHCTMHHHRLIAEDNILRSIFSSRVSIVIVNRYALIQCGTSTAVNPLKRVFLPRKSGQKAS